MHKDDLAPSSPEQFQGHKFKEHQDCMEILRTQRVSLQVRDFNQSCCIARRMLMGYGGWVVIKKKIIIFVYFLYPSQMFSHQSSGSYYLPLSWTLNIRWPTETLPIAVDLQMHVLSEELGTLEFQRMFECNLVSNVFGYFAGSISWLEDTFTVQ
jgi:hypothetical protein